MIADLDPSTVSVAAPDSLTFQPPAPPPVTVARADVQAELDADVAALAQVQQAISDLDAGQTANLNARISVLKNLLAQMDAAAAAVETSPPTQPTS